MIKAALFLYICKAAILAFDARESSPGAAFPVNRAAVETSLPDAVSNPAAFPVFSYPYVNFGGSRPYSLGDLYTSTIKLGYGHGPFGIQARWDRFGIPGYEENVVDAGIGWRPVTYLSIGAGATYYNLAINTEGITLNTHLVDAKAGIIIFPCRWIEVAFQHENMTSLFIKKRRDLLYPGWSAGLVIKPVPGLSLSWNINRTPCTLVNSTAASVNILKYIGVKVGYAVELHTFTAALSIMYKYVALSYGLRYHENLGFTHSIGVTLTASSLDIEPLSYGRIDTPARQKKIERVDINSCQLADLEGIPGVTHTMAERIIKYRKMIGPITRKSLVQIGMSGKEISRFCEYIYGLKKDSFHPSRKKKRRYRNRGERKKRLFVRLLNQGIKARTALRIAEGAVHGTGKELRAIVASLPDISPAEKREVLRICEQER